MSYKIVWENDGVLSQFDGIFSSEIHNKALNALFGDSRIDDIKYIIGDYSKVSDNFLNENDVEYSLAMTTGAATYLKDIKIALVAVDKEIIDLCKYYIELASRFNTTWEVRLFDNIDAARDWASSK